MAENIVSPGVFTRENDLSFLPQGIGAIGAAVVGPTVKGPAFVPTVIRRGFSEFEQKFGPLNQYTYVPQTVKEYLKNAGSVTVVRVLAGGGHKLDPAASTENSMIAIGVSSGSFSGSVVSGGGWVNSDKDTIVATFFPSKNTGTIGLKDTFASFDGNTGSLNQFTDDFSITFSGSSGFTGTGKQYSASLNPTNANYVIKSIGNSGENSKTGANSWEATAHVRHNFKTLQAAIAATGGHASYQGLGSGSNLFIITQSAALTYTSSYAEGYSNAYTPWITSGYQSGVVKNLCKFYTLADGTSTNTEYKIGISGLREPADIDGEEQYSTFNVLVRKYGDKDSSPVILEQFNNCNLDPDSPNFISRVIGDRYAAYSSTFAKVITYGDYPNLSKLIRVEVTDAVKQKAESPKLSPKGFRGVLDPIRTASFGHNCTFPSASYEGTQVIGTTYNAKGYLGWKFTDKEVDNYNWTGPVPENAETNVSGDFNVEDYSGHASSGKWVGSLSASLDTTGTSGPKNSQLQFIVPFQGGFDGLDTGTVIKTGEYITADNMQGMDLSGTGASGYTGYKKAIDILSNQDEYDINMLVLPGVLKQIHSSVTDAATTMAEDRGDTFYVMDLTKVDATVTTAVNEASSLDSNYAAVYYPWVKVLDTSINKPVFVPPSVIVPGAIAASDSIAAEWFAPAGLNRGVLGNVLEAKIRLNQAERDELYEGKVNPIATFPRTGVCIWGQKTLQTRPTALDRINVRRLLITVKKFIASASKYLVFEQNTTQTRNRFLNIANPYLESVQQRQGLYAFRVVMDESNNTPEEIDRNRLIGAIYLQPTKTAEFIVLDFNVLPTGATFDA